MQKYGDAFSKSSSIFAKLQMVPADDNVYPYAAFSSLLNSRFLIESVLDTNRARCSVGPDLGTNYLQSILSDSLGPVVNILIIFSNANILKKIQHQRYRLSVID